MKDAKKIRDELQRFAEYDDLKALHNKVVPKINTFELLVEDF